MPQRCVSEPKGIVFSTRVFRGQTWFSVLQVGCRGQTLPCFVAFPRASKDTSGQRDRLPIFCSSGSLRPLSVACRVGFTRTGNGRRSRHTGIERPSRIHQFLEPLRGKDERRPSPSTCCDAATMLNASDRRIRDSNRGAETSKNERLLSHV